MVVVDFQASYLVLQLAAFGANEVSRKDLLLPDCRNHWISLELNERLTLPGDEEAY